MKNDGVAGGGSRLTMADISRMAGVSKITVSRALRDSDLVRPEVRDRIHQIAERSGYRLNVAARDLRQGQRRRVGVIVEMAPSEARPMSGPYPLVLLGGIVQELAAAGYGVLLSSNSPHTRAEVEDASGIILLGQGQHHDAVNALAGRRVPLVIWGADDGYDAPAIVVGSDNRHGGELAAEHLVGQGRRRLIFLGDIAHAEAADRLAGFRAAAEAAGALVIATPRADFNSPDAAAAVRRLLDDGVRFDGVFAASDLMAIGAIEALSAAGLRAGTDIGIVGYDDAPAAAAASPPLTTIHQNWEAGGRLLARKLLEALDGGQPVSEMLPTSLIVRAT